MTASPLNFDSQKVLNDQLELITRLQHHAYLSPNAENLERFNLAVEGATRLMELTLATIQISQTGSGRSGGPD